MSDGIELMLDAVLDGRCDEETLRRFEGLVHDDPRVREAYLDQVRMHALLEWRHGRVSPQVECAESGRKLKRSWTGRWTRRGLVAVALIGVGLALLASRHVRLGRGDEIATLVEARDVVWAANTSPIAVNARLSPREIRCESGMVRLAFDSGALVTLEGPADLQILSGMRLRALRGRITALAKGEAIGFTIETPSSLVVDRGTEFGVEVDAAGRTGVVVFQGLVDLSSQKSSDGPPPIKRLSQGEGMRVDRAGVLSRIMEVERQPGDEWSTGPSSDRDALIRSVSDNIRGLESSKYYQIVRRGLEDDAPAYVDRPHEWNGLDASGLPAFLRGADYIMTFNEDKWRNDLEITVDVARAATFYIFLDDREKPPFWLDEQFTDTGVNIGLDEGSWPDTTRFSTARGPGQSINKTFSVWEREVETGESIRLGALAGGKNNRAMYGIAAVARP